MSVYAPPFERLITELSKLPGIGVRTAQRLAFHLMRASEEDAFKKPVRDQYERQGSPYYSTARLWDDGVIDPADTRRVLGLALSAAANASLEPAGYGVFRM